MPGRRPSPAWIDPACIGRLAWCVALSAAAALLAGCDLPESALKPAPRELVVHAVLDVGSTSQVVTLEWSDRSPRLPAGRAQVFLGMPDGRELSFTPSEGRDGETYRLTTVFPFTQLQPGAEYTLRVVDGPNVVTGTTTIPNAQPVLGGNPRTPFSRSSDTLRLSWSRVGGASAYYVTVQNTGGSGREVFYSTFADTSIVLPGTLRTLDNEQVFETGASATVMVSAVDDNFYTYYHAAVDPFAGAPPSRLSSALGVFGSLVPIVIRRVSVTQ